MTGPEKRQARLPREHSASSRNAGPDNRDPQSLVEAGRVCRASSSSLAQRIIHTHRSRIVGQISAGRNVDANLCSCRSSLQRQDQVAVMKLSTALAWPMSEVTYEELFPAPVAKDE